MLIGGDKDASCLEGMRGDDEIMGTPLQPRRGGRRQQLGVDLGGGLVVRQDPGALEEGFKEVTAPLGPLRCCRPEDTDGEFGDCDGRHGHGVLGCSQLVKREGAPLKGDQDTGVEDQVSHGSTQGWFAAR